MKRRPLLSLLLITALSVLPLRAEAAGTQAVGIGQHADPQQRATPNDLLRLLGKYIEARDLDGIISIHEPVAGLVEFGGGVSRGDKSLRESYRRFFTMQPKLTVNPLQIVDAGGVAIILGDYRLDYVDENGEAASTTGKFGDMVRQQPDGSWLYLLDNPFAP